MSTLTTLKVGCHLDVRARGALLLITWVPEFCREFGRSVRMLAAGRVRLDQRGDVNVTTLNSASKTMRLVTKRQITKRKTTLRKLPRHCAALFGLLSVALAGCESGSSVLGGGANSPQTNLALPPPATTSSQVAKIQIAPIIGSPDNVARDLAAQLTTAIERNRLTVAKAPNVTAEYTLRGYIVASREKTGSKISYIWDITDPAGKRIKRLEGEELAPGAGKDPWSSVTPQVVQRIADKAASQIATAIPAGTSSAANIPIAAAPPASGSPSQIGGLSSSSAPLTTAATTPAAATTGSIEQTGPINTIVPTVTGAPGDGSASLTTAIQRELSKSGVSLTNAPSPKTYKVEGKVAMGQARDGKQPIQIDWNVIDPTGKKVGTVSQKNEVAQGSLDGTWGKTADQAAAAAAQGIVKLLPSQRL